MKQSGRMSRFVIPVETGTQNDMKTRGSRCSLPSHV